MKLIKKLSIGAFGVAFSIAAGASSYPSKPVHLLVGATPGSITDLLARVLADGLSKQLDGSFIVENKPGANGILAAQMVARAKPDGYTLFVSNSSALTVNPLLFENLKYSMDDFIGITSVVSSPFALAINPENDRLKDVTSLEGLIDKARAEPDSVTFGSAGVGNLMHLAAERLGVLSNTKMSHIPYKSAVLAETALLGQEIDYVFVTSSTLPMIRDGRLKPLAVSSKERWHELPDTPTIAELGYEDFDIGFWLGVSAPKETPKEIVDLLNSEIQKLVKQPEVEKRLSLLGTVDVMNSDDFMKKIKLSIEQNAELMEKANIQKISN